VIDRLSFDIDIWLTLSYHQAICTFMGYTLTVRTSTKNHVIEGQTMQWPRKVINLNNCRQNTSKKTKDWTTRTPQERGEFEFPGVISSSCSISGTCHVALVNKSVMGHERGKDVIDRLSFDIDIWLTLSYHQAICTFMGYTLTVRTSTKNHVYFLQHLHQ
jgi:hypothetical protein